MKLKLTQQEKEHFIYLVPVQGTIELMEMVQGILDKVNNSESNEEIVFSEKEQNLLKGSVESLNQMGKINLVSLSLAKLILNYNSTKGE